MSRASRSCALLSFPSFFSTGNMRGVWSSSWNGDGGFSFIFSRGDIKSGRVGGSEMSRLCWKSSGLINSRRLILSNSISSSGMGSSFFGLSKGSSHMSVREYSQILVSSNEFPSGSSKKLIQSQRGSSSNVGVVSSSFSSTNIQISSSVGGTCGTWGTCGTCGFGSLGVLFFTIFGGISFVFFWVVCSGFG